MHQKWGSSPARSSGEVRGAAAHQKIIFLNMMAGTLGSTQQPDEAAFIVCCHLANHRGAAQTQGPANVLRARTQFERKTSKHCYLICI